MNATHGLLLTRKSSFCWLRSFPKHQQLYHHATTILRKYFSFKPNALVKTTRKQLMKYKTDIHQWFRNYVWEKNRIVWKYDKNVKICSQTQPQTKADVNL